jgi:hypothetical protein
MLTVTTLLLLLGFLCFCAAAVNVQSRIGLTPLGLAFWILAELLNASGFIRAR